MANILGALGAAATVGGLISNAFDKKKTKGARAGLATEIPAEINQYGIQRDNLGVVDCTVPKGMEARYKLPSIVKGIAYRSEQFNVPGVSIQTSDIRRYGIGPTQRMPIGSVNNSTFTLNFIADQQGIYYQYFKAWMDYIVHFDDRKTPMNVASKFGTFNYEVEYMENYVTDIKLVELDPKYNEITTTTLVDAYPVAIQDKQINWGNSGLMMFTVEFAFAASDTSYKQLEAGFAKEVSANGSGIIGNLIKAGNTLQLLSSIKKSGGFKGVAGAVGAGALAISTISSIRR